MEVYNLIYIESERDGRKRYRKEDRDTSWDGDWRRVWAWDCWNLGEGGLGC